MHDIMEYKIVVVAIVVLCSSWIAYSDVDCSEKGTFIHPADSTCRAYVTCTFNATISSYTLTINTCDTDEIFDVESQGCVASDTNTCSVSFSHARRSRAISADAITEVSLTGATTESTSGLTPQTTELTTEIGDTTISSTEHEISASTIDTTEAISTTGATTAIITTEEATTITQSTTVTTETTELTSVATNDPTSEPATSTEFFTDTTTITTDITTTESVTIVPTVITTEATTLITDTTTTELPTSTPTLSPDNFVCTSVGRFSDETDESCRTYYLCVLTSTGTFVTYKYTCPSGSAFSPTSDVCSASYTCSRTSTSTSSSTSTSTTSTTSSTTTTTTKSPITFACTAAGRFSDPSDNSCSSYYMCISSAGSFISYKYTCPSGSYFNPASRVCTTSYACPK